MSAIRVHAFDDTYLTDPKQIIQKLGQDNRDELGDELPTVYLARICP